jgi:hypothetical protein
VYASDVSWPVHVVGAFTRRAVDSCLLPLTRSVGDCYDNAMLESFGVGCRSKLFDRKRWSTRIEGQCNSDIARCSLRSSGQLSGSPRRSPAPLSRLKTLFAPSN